MLSAKLQHLHGFIAGFILSLQSRYVSQEHSRDHTTLKTMCILLLSMIFPLPLCKCYQFLVCIEGISGTSSGTYRVFEYSVFLFQYFRMVSVLCSSGGEQKRTKKNRTPILLGMIEPPILNGVSRPSGKRLQLHSWDMDGTYNRSIKPLANQAPAGAPFLDIDFAILLEAIVSLIKC